MPGRFGGLVDMLEVKAEPFVNAIEALSFARAAIENDTANFSGPMHQSNREESIRFLKTIIKAAGTLNAPNTKREAKFILEKLGDKAIKYEDFRALLSGLSRLFRGEISGTKVFSVTPEKGRYFRSASFIFGTEALAVFPNAEYDFEEAAKSLATARNTACVFHLMRAMEMIVAVAGAQLNATVIDKSNQALEWGKILANMSARIEAMDKGDIRTQWNAVHSLLYHVKEAWRNPTMHPGEKYTDDEAREILDAVRAFVRAITPLIDPWRSLVVHVDAEDDPLVGTGFGS